MRRKPPHALLREAFPDDLLTVEEYIGEAEHQDGYDYWRQFDNAEELLADFRLYLDNVKGTENA